MTDISIHAPRVGSDFYLTRKVNQSIISIHAPRVGSDDGIRACGGARADFNPRSPRGERLLGASNVLT